MPLTIRKFWPNPFPVGTRTSLNFNWNAIDFDSVVVITASGYRHEPNPPPGQPLERVLNRFGTTLATTVRVDNISPHGPRFDNNHGVTFSIQVDLAPNVSNGDMFVVTDITVLDGKPVVTQN